MEGQRRIITGHDGGATAIFLADEQLTASGLREAEVPGASFFNVWSTERMPVLITEETLAEQRQGCSSTTRGSGAGSVLRVGILAPGSRSPMHRTESLDYAICLEGECDLELDGGDVRTMHAGDIAIQRATNHVWHNRSERPCRFAWILLDAEPVLVDGQPLAASWSV